MLFLHVQCTSTELYYVDCGYIHLRVSFIPSPPPPCCSLLNRTIVVRKAVATFDVPMWEPTGEKIDLTEGQPKDPAKEAEEKAAQEVKVMTKGVEGMGSRSCVPQGGSSEEL